MDAVGALDEVIEAAWEVVLTARPAMPEQSQRRFGAGGKAAEAMVPTAQAVEGLPRLPFQQRDANFERQATAGHRGQDRSEGCALWDAQSAAGPWRDAPAAGQVVPFMTLESRIVFDFNAVFPTIFVQNTRAASAPQSFDGDALGEVSGLVPSRNFAARRERRLSRAVRLSRRRPRHSTVTLFARLRGLSTSVPRAHAV